MTRRGRKTTKVKRRKETTAARGLVSSAADLQKNLDQRTRELAEALGRNARLFDDLQKRTQELTEALDQQTATANILRIISSSPTDVQSVFDMIVRNFV